LINLGQDKKNNFHLFGALKFAVNAPIFLKNNKGLFFDSIGKDYSKSGTAFLELKNSKLLSNDKVILVGSRKSLFNYLSRLLRYLYYRIIFYKLINRLRKSKNLSDFNQSIILGYLAFQRFFLRNTEMLPLVISDTSINYLIISYSANNISGVFWWQDDIHHRQEPTYKLGDAALLSSELYEKFSKKKNFLLFKRSIGNIKKIKFPHNIKNIGIAVNATFIGSNAQIFQIEKIKKNTGVININLRLHPTSEKKFFLPSWLIISDKFESIEKFSDRNDLIFVGNSAIQLKILKEGVLVFHVSDLDIEGYDLYGYVKKGIVFGSEIIDSDSINKLIDFYRKNEYFEKLFEEVI
jgi:hypothetical protein